MVQVVLYVRQSGALGRYMTQSYWVSGGTTLKVLELARQMAYAAGLEVGGVDFIQRNPADVPSIVDGETVVQAGNPDVQGVVTRTGRTTTVEWRGNVCRHSTYPDLAVFTRREDGQLVAD